MLNGVEHFSIYIPDMLTADLLEKEPETYKYLLERYAEYKRPNEVRRLANSDYPDPITSSINSTDEYGGWYSSHTHCLSYLVGEKTDFAKNKLSECGNPTDEELWYGCNINIPDEEGVEILKLMLGFGARLDIKNFYGETIEDTIVQAEKLTGREKNEQFKHYTRYPEELI